MIEKTIAFLKEYKALCEKYKLFISACGCCDSPWLITIGNDKDINEEIKHLIEELGNTLVDIPVENTEYLTELKEKRESIKNEVLYEIAIN